MSNSRRLSQLLIAPGDREHRVSGAREALRLFGHTRRG